MADTTLMMLSDMLTLFGVLILMGIAFVAGHSLAASAAGDIEAKLAEEMKQELIELRKWKADHIGK